MDSKAAIKNSALFKDFNSLELLKVTEIGRRRFLPKGSAVIAQGDEFEEGDTSLYTLASGLVKVVMPLGDGKELVLAILTPPEHFGEMSFVDHKPRSADVIAMEDTELIVFQHDALDGLLSEEVEMSLKFYRALSKSLVQKIRKMNARVIGGGGR